MPTCRPCSTTGNWSTIFCSRQGPREPGELNADQAALPYGISTAACPQRGSSPGSRRTPGIESAWPSRHRTRPSGRSTGDPGSANQRCSPRGEGDRSACRRPGLPSSRGSTSERPMPARMRGEPAPGMPAASWRSRPPNPVRRGCPVPGESPGRSSHGRRPPAQRRLAMQHPCLTNDD